MDIEDSRVLTAQEMLAFGLGAFHTASLMAVVVVAAYSRGGLGGTLEDLNPAAGIGLFLALWGSTWYCTRKVVLATAADAAAPSDVRLFRDGLWWGGWNGVIFFALLAAGIGIALAGHNIANGDYDALPSILFGLALAILFGGAAAFVVGVIVGAFVTVVDLLMLDLARGLLDVRRRDAGSAD